MYKFAKLGIGAAILCGAIVAMAVPAVAQRYDDQRQNQRQNYDPYRGRSMADIVNFIIDPATGRRITQAQYQARYPWTNPRTWTYDPPSNLWTDHTRDYGNDYREDSRDRGRRR